ncbi:hypothetical protein [Roseofilum capinflatum]|uniref:Uncharacterized protein n=1 Tax=Roseofilum capinflatum BLCC-M114 TaxID=3022440 RepID=A0ABT7B289_9CYAN|nr:hypothetical protein [Roseofilum capinflatum]MDJ1173281.1 hypothetical protein [Roseofilum capinflatum BLCC-M114]
MESPVSKSIIRERSQISTIPSLFPMRVPLYSWHTFPGGDRVQ